VQQHSGSGFEAGFADGHWTVTLARPQRRNALDEAFALELAACFRELSASHPGVPMVLRADGPAFSAGADVSFLKGVTDRDERERLFRERARHLTPALVDVVDALARCDLVTIAAVQGAASGGGWSLALACDFRIAAPEATFWFPEAEYGRPLSEMSIAMLLPKVGQARTTEIVLGANRYGAPALHAIGLINEVVPRDALDAHAQRLARRLAAMSPLGLAESKRRIRRLATAVAPQDASAPILV
jgi:enoyl-CoA hydratase/carnithine racemase